MKNLIFISFMSLFCFSLIGQTNQQLASNIATDMEQLGRQIIDRNTKDEISKAAESYDKHQNLDRLLVTDLKIDPKLINRINKYNESQKKLILDENEGRSTLIRDAFIVKEGGGDDPQKWPPWAHCAAGVIGSAIGVYGCVQTGGLACPGAVLAIHATIDVCTNH